MSSGPRQALAGCEPHSLAQRCAPAPPPPSARPTVFAAWRKSHFNNAENALWKNSCSDSVGALLTLGFDMSAKCRIKNMQRALLGLASSLLPSTTSPGKFKTKRISRQQWRNSQHTHPRKAAFSCPFKNGLVIILCVF